MRSVTKKRELYYPVHCCVCALRVCARLFLIVCALRVRARSFLIVCLTLPSPSKQSVPFPTELVEKFACLGHNLLSAACSKLLKGKAREHCSLGLLSWSHSAKSPATNRKACLLRGIRGEGKTETARGSVLAFYICHAFRLGSLESSAVLSWKLPR